MQDTEFVVGEAVFVSNGPRLYNGCVMNAVESNGLMKVWVYDIDQPVGFDCYVETSRVFKTTVVMKGNKDEAS